MTSGAASEGVDAAHRGATLALAGWKTNRRPIAPITESPSLRADPAQGSPRPGPPRAPCHFAFRKANVLFEKALLRVASRCLPAGRDAVLVSYSRCGAVLPGAAGAAGQPHAPLPLTAVMDVHSQSVAFRLPRALSAQRGEAGRHESGVRAPPLHLCPYRATSSRGSGPGSRSRGHRSATCVCSKGGMLFKRWKNAVWKSMFIFFYFLLPRYNKSRIKSQNTHTKKSIPPKFDTVFRRSKNAFWQSLRSTFFF